MMGMSNPEIATFLDIPAPDVESHVAELVEDDRLGARVGEVQGPTGRRGTKAWDHLRPAIREMYEENTPHGSIRFMLGITPIELNTQLRRLFKEGLQRRH